MGPVRLQEQIIFPFWFDLQDGQSQFLWPFSGHVVFDLQHRFDTLWNPLGFLSISSLYLSHRLLFSFIFSFSFMYHFKPSKNIFYMKWDVRNDAKNNSGKGTANAPVHSEQVCFEVSSCHLAKYCKGC